MEFYGSARTPSIRAHHGQAGRAARTIIRRRTAYPVKLQLTRPTGSGNIISGYGDDHVLINGERYGGSLLLTADAIMAWDAPRFSALVEGHFEAIVALAPDVVLLGTGPRLRFPAAALTVPLARAGIGLEVMDLRAACRTYNVLRAEERRVAAALLFE